MRRTFTILLALVALASLARPQPQPQRKRLPGPLILYGPIHTIRDERTTFTIVNGELVEGARALVMTATFNEDATKQEKTLYADGEIISRTEETFDPDGRVIANNNQGGTDRTVYNPDGTIKERVRRVGEFDSYQNLIKSTLLTATGDSFEYRPTTITYRSITYYPKN